MTMPSTFDLVEALQSARTNRNETLAEMSQRAPVLVVFLRHAGCTFCREAISDLAKRQAAIEKLGTQIAVVHQGEDFAIAAMCQKFGLQNAAIVADPEHRLYQAFELRRGGARALLSPYVFWRGMTTALFSGFGFAYPRTDPRQMPGAFLIHQNRIIKAFRHNTAADRPDYNSLACPVG
jgi:peroxiredoxin